MSDAARMTLARQRYERAMHAVQSGIAMYLNRDPETPKSTRVGITSCQVSDVALARLLMKKGIITEVEYHEAVADAAEEEVKFWKQRLSAEFGISVDLA